MFLQLLSGDPRGFYIEALRNGPNVGLRGLVLWLHELGKNTTTLCKKVGKTRREDANELKGDRFSVGSIPDWLLKSFEVLEPYGDNTKAILYAWLERVEE